MNTPDAAHAAGVTYRQVDHWLRCGLGTTRMCSTCGFTAYIDDCWCDREQCEHTVWVPEIESWVRCTANTLMHTPDTRVLCPEHCSCNEGASVDYPPLPDFLIAECMEQTR